MSLLWSQNTGSECLVNFISYTIILLAQSIASCNCFQGFCGRTTLWPDHSNIACSRPADVILHCTSQWKTVHRIHVFKNTLMSYYIVLLSGRLSIQYICTTYCIFYICGIHIPISVSFNSLKRNLEGLYFSQCNAEWAVMNQWTVPLE